MQNQLSIQDACRTLELPLHVWPLRQGMDFNQAVKSLESFKVMIKSHRKQLAKKYHPDKTGGDDTKIKEINNIVDLLMKVEIQAPQPRPVTVVHFTSTSSSFTSSSNQQTYYRRW